MRLKYYSFLIIFPILVSLGQDREVELWNFKQLETYIDSNGDLRKLKVINFWATWCAPCIKEMPYFEEASKRFKGEIELLFVSLDFEEQLESKVVPLLDKKEIQSKVVLLTDSDYNEWIDKIDNSWSGALPATLMILPDGRKLFYESQFERKELFKIIEDSKTKK